MLDPRDDELRTLLSEPLDRFVAARNARVKALRAEGRREEAALLATVRKPSRLAHRVAHLAALDPDAAHVVVRAAEDVQDAQEGEGDLREAMAALRPAIDAVLAPASPRDRADLGVPLRAVLADRDARQAWRDGVLVELPGAGTGAALAPSGRHLTLVPTGPDVVAPEPSGSSSRRGRNDDEARRLEQERQAAVAARAALQAKVDEAETAVAGAEGELREATAAEAEATGHRDQVHRALDDAEAEVVAAGVEVADAEQRVAALQQAVADARAELADASESTSRDRR